MATRTAQAYRGGARIGLIWLETVDGVQVERATARAYRAMQAAAAADGIELKLSSGFRSMAEQTRLYAEHQAGTLATPVARPGYSNHQSGVALDIHVGGNSVMSPEYLWLQEHAAGFGFLNTGASFSTPEWWHWERVS